MSVQPVTGPFVFNVAGLLADDVGSHRDIDVRVATIDLPEDLALATPLAGRVRLAKTNRGVLADVGLTGALATECVRCLRPTTVPFDVVFEEEYLPSLDLATGHQVSIEDEPDSLRLTDHHELDLTPSVRDAVALAEPIAPLDRPDCPGLCIVCGQPLDEGTHDHPDDDLDPRFEALRNLKLED